MRRRRGHRSTWFPILGFDTTGAGALGESTVDVRQVAVNPNGAPNIVIIPIIPDIDVPVEQPQTIGGEVRTTLRDYVEGQSCIIDRIVGTIQAGVQAVTEGTEVRQSVFAVGVAVVPTTDDGTGNPAVSATELDPLRADNSANPWMWRRLWVLEAPSAATFQTTFPQNNLERSDIRSGPHIDTKGTKRAIRREERIFLIYSTQPLFPDNSGTGVAGVINVATDLRVLGRIVKAHNRSNFK